MTCRPGCGACCIAPSISSPIPGMPHGKPKGVRCIHLNEDCLCEIFDSPERPKVCEQFHPEIEFCGRNRKEALEIMLEMEKT